MWPPSAAFESAALGFLDLHLRENETAAAEFATLLAERRPSAVQPPVPKREDEHVGKPELGAGTQELNRCSTLRLIRESRLVDESLSATIQAKLQTIPS